MEITVQEFKHCDMITVKGRVDSSTALQLAQALEAANDGGKYKLVVNMEGLEYMSSAIERTGLSAAQVVATLLSLELGGRIRQLPGQQYIRL